MQHTCAHFFVVVLHDDSVKLASYTFYAGNVVCVPVRSFFSTAAHFSLWWPLVFLSQVVPTAIKSSYFSSDEIGLL